ncbi:hypothetical protein LCGC14_3140160 [marine sediment metagenome]|uniref:Uncharacterized protein n=1 Tax=marine sediment metagenome TaxID=412755 RepID=A0A0F8Y440_9ZZZZ
MKTEFKNGEIYKCIVRYQFFTAGKIYIVKENLLGLVGLLDNRGNIRINILFVEDWSSIFKKIYNINCSKIIII